MADLSKTLAAELGQLARKLAAMEASIAQLKRNQRTAGLGNATIDTGSLTVTNANGDPVIQIGLQDDGSYALNPVGSDVPLALSTPSLSAGIVEIQATWDGTLFTGTTPPADFSACQVHLSPNSGFVPDNTTLQGTLTSPGTFRIGGSLTPGTNYYVVFVQVNVHGNLSAPSVQASCIPLSPVAAIGPGQLTAQQLGLPGGVLNPNPYFLGGYGGDYTAVNGTFTVVGAGAGLIPGVPYGFGGQYVNNGIANGYLQENGGQFPVTPGAQYLITCWANTSDGQVNLGISWLGGVSGGTNTVLTVNATAGVWTQVQAVITAPTTGVTAGFPIAGLPGNDGGTLQVAGFLALQSVPGGLVQAGTITAAQIAAGTIVAGIIDSTVVNSATFNGSTFNGVNWTENPNGSFFYSPSEAAGNLVTSITSGGGPDQYGNYVLPGVTNYIPQGGGGWVAVQCAAGSVNFWFATNMVSTTNPWGDIGEIVAFNGTPNFLQISPGTGVGDYISFTGPVTATTISASGPITTASQISSPPTPASGATIYADGDGIPSAVTSGGLNAHIPLTLTEATLRSNATTAPTQISAAITIPANEAVAGATYRMRVYGTGTSGTTAQLFGITMAAFSSGAVAGTGWSAGSLTASTSFDWWAEALVVITATGASGTARFFLSGAVSVAGRTTTSQSWPFQNAVTSQTIDTTTSSTLEILAAPGSTTGSPSINGHCTTFERLGA